MSKLLFHKITAFFVFYIDFNYLVRANLAFNFLFSGISGLFLAFEFLFFRISRFGFAFFVNNLQVLSLALLQVPWLVQG